MYVAEIDKMEKKPDKIANRKLRSEMKKANKSEENHVQEERDIDTRKYQPNLLIVTYKWQRTDEERDGKRMGTNVWQNRKVKIKKNWIKLNLMCPMIKDNNRPTRVKSIILKVERNSRMQRP